MKIKYLKNSIVLSLITIIFISCDETQVFDEYKTIPNAEWHKDSIAKFTFERKASKTPYNLFINIRNNNDYEFNNIFLIVKLEQPNGLIKVDTLEYQMANSDGILLGTGFSNVKESKLWYKENFSFLRKGKYKATIQQAIRQTGKIKGVEKLKGINEIGFRIESIQKK